MYPQETRGQFWRKGRDSNSRYPFGYAAFRERYLQPLGHLSIPFKKSSRGVRHRGENFFPSPICCTMEEEFLQDIRIIGKRVLMMNAEGVGFVDPARVISQIDVALGATVADFGCGSGYFSFEFSRVVGPDGRVYALDVFPQALEAVLGQSKLMGIHNIVTKRANLEREGGSTLGLASVDWVILKDMLFQNEHKDIIIAEMARVLKPGGHAIVMEWNPKASAIGPDKKLRIDPEELKTLLLASGLSLEKNFPAGGYHYAFLVKKV